MKHKALLAAATALATIALCGCMGNEPEGPYKVTLYSGGSLVCEWDSVSSYKMLSTGCIELDVDGDWISILGGTVVID